MDEKKRSKNMIGEYLTYPSIAINFLKADKKINHEKIKLHIEKNMHNKKHTLARSQGSSA